VTIRCPYSNAVADPDLQIRGGPWPQKKFFSALHASFWSKNEGGGVGPPGPSPGSATEMYPNPNTLNFPAK